MSTLSTHVLDTALGRPAAGVPVELAAPAPGGGGTWAVLTTTATDADGRARDLGDVPPGRYRLQFDTAAYAAARGGRAFFPEVSIVFEVTDDGHHHVPLLLSPFGYSTYRGS